MANKYHIRSLAESDLEAIWLYTVEQWSVDQADTYLESLINRFDWLADNPLLGKQRDDVKKGYYCFPEGMHLVFYKVELSGRDRFNDNLSTTVDKIINNQIEIIGIPHQSMDMVETLK